jgi:hypothetical protein
MGPPVKASRFFRGKQGDTPGQVLPVLLSIRQKQLRERMDECGYPAETHKASPPLLANRLMANNTRSGTPRYGAPDASLSWSDQLRCLTTLTGGSPFQL